MYIFSCPGISTYTVRNIQRVRQISDHSIQQVLHAFIFERRTAHHRTEVHGDHSLPNHCFQVFDCDRVRIFKETFHQSFVLHSSSFYQFLSPFLSFSHHIFGNFFHGSFHSTVFPNISFHFYQVDNTLIVIFRSDRKYQRNRIST